MDEKVVLQQLLEAHQLLRHDFMNNLQVITGYQQIGQPEKANEYIFRIVNFLRSFSGLGKMEAPLLKGLLISYLTKYPEPSVFTVKIDSTPTLSPGEESELAELLHGVMGSLEDSLQAGETSCQILLGAKQEALLCFVLEGQGEAFKQARGRIDTLLNNSFYSGEIQEKGNTMQVKIISGK